MSYDGSSSAPGSDTRGRVGRSEHKGEELEEGAGPGANAPNNNDGGRAPAPAGVAVAMPTDRERGSSPGSGSGSSGGERRGGNRDDTDALSSGNDSGGNHGNGGSRRRQSTRSSLSSSHGKDSAMMETSDSNKSSSSPRPSPPSSSLAYSLLSSEGRDPPSTSGCSSAQSARVRTQKQLMTALKELKIRLPAERRGKGHSSTLDALKYALSCVKQVRANQEYYHQWSVEECQGCSLDLSSFTIEELDTITSEYTLKNTDSFSMAVSFLTGKVVYVSPHGASLLRCGARRLTAGVFSELLAPQDVSTFYSGTAPKRLPRWDAGGGGGVSPAADCAQEKSMFCRISAERAHGGEMRYYPFRLTPYQLTLRDSDLADPQPCCLLIGERVHSGYEAPRIPPDKRVFTTSHTPSCLFQEIDERAVPLLGYLPQDLVGTPVLLYLHPEDRPIMVAITKKILQFAGQPFDHSPLRMVARSGEYLTIDTSWSSFVNPWSRKVAFIVGRHKVRTSPLNEDVFTPPRGQESRLSVVPEVVQLSEQIHRVLSAPVHHSATAGRHGSQGGSQGSLGSSGSRGSRGAGGSSSRRERPHLLRGSAPAPAPAPAASSCGESTGLGPAPNEEDAVVATAVAVALHKPMSFHQMCSDVQRVKTSGQQVFIESRNRAPPRKTAAPGVGGGLMAVCGDEPITRPVSDVAEPPKALSPAQLVRKEPPSAFSYQQINCLDSIIRYLDSCNVPNTVKRKCASSSATGSSASDDDKEAATDVVMEEAPPTAAPAPTPIALPPPPPPARRGGGGGATGVGGACLGLTKEVLSAHTQREEQVFLCRFRDLSQLTVFDSASTNASNLARGVRCSRDYPAAVGGASNGRRRCRRAKRLKHQESASPSPSSPPLPLPPLCLLPSDAPPPPLPGPALPLMASAPPPSLSPWPAPLPPAPLPPAVLPLYPLYPPLGAAAPPMMALVLPNFLFPQLAPPTPLAPPQQFYNPVPYPTPFPPPPLALAPAAVAMAPPQRGPSRSSTPLSVCGPAEGAESPLFQSRCSSPLNLLQLEEATPTAVMSGQQATPPTQQQGGGAGGKDNAKDNENSNQDAMSTSSDLLDLLLQEDSRSGTGSAASGSGSLGTGSSGSGSGSGSNGCSSSGSRTRSSQSSHTSKYFGSADDSDQSRHSRRRPAGGSSDEQFIKSVLQDPIWLLMANTDRKVMMTYQLPVRDMEVVLREDREALRNMQKLQPRFTEEQKAELSQVHPWIRTGRLPRTINVNACMGCKSPPAPPFDVETHEMELCGALEASEDKPVAVDAVARGNDQEMTSVDPAAPAKPAATVDAETDMAH